MTGKVFSTSYNTPEIAQFITSFVALINPRVVVEIGTQQARSTILIGRGMKKGASLYTYDLFETHYNQPPHLPTHANLDKAVDNIYKAGLPCTVFTKQHDGLDALTHRHDSIDLLHIDICCHEANLRTLLGVALPKVTRAVMLEGGFGTNSWQKKYGFKPYGPMLTEPWVSNDWHVLTIPFTEDNAITLLTRRHING